MQALYKTVRDILCDVLGAHPDDVTPSFSLDAVAPADWGAIVIACEQAFSITFDDERVYDLHTVGDLLRVIAGYAGDGPLTYTQPNDVEREAWYYE